MHVTTIKTKTQLTGIAYAPCTKIKHIRDVIVIIVFAFLCHTGNMLYKNKYCRKGTFISISRYLMRYRMFTDK